MFRRILALAVFCLVAALECHTQPSLPSTFQSRIVHSVPIRLSPKTTRCWVLPFSRVKFIVSWGDSAASNAEQ